MSAWALDLGTTNTGVATWDAEARRPRFVDFDQICRKPAAGEEDALEAPRVVPSCVHLVRPEGLWGRLSTWSMFKRRLWSSHGLIGREALEKNAGAPHAAFAPSFKAALMRSPYKSICRLEGVPRTAREVARVFVRELMRHAVAKTGERWRELVVTTPVDAYETYRAELIGIAHDLGIKKVRFLDEPVAAAIGYGVGIGAKRQVLVVDMGGGTAHAAVVTLDYEGVRQGTCQVISKTGRQLGGNLVDRWLVEEFCKRLGFVLRHNDEDEGARFWYQMMVDEARRVKESVFFRQKDAFYLTPPEEMRAFEARVRGDAQLLEVTQDDVRQILEARGYYASIEAMVDEALGAAARAGVGIEKIDTVLLTGGSTLLPEVYPLFERRFGRDRVRAWQPFESVTYGAAAFAAGAVTQSDYIVHDYAFVTYDPKTNDPRQTLIIPKGTRVPTVPDLWKKQLVPTCALGEPEKLFKLVISEVGEAEPAERRFAWDEGGQLKKLGGVGESAVERVVVALNEANPTLGELEPPHQPGDKRPRLEISFGVNAERWLIATVRDLKTQRLVMDQQAVVRLL